jgi:hypothetical protein
VDVVVDDGVKEEVVGVVVVVVDVEAEDILGDGLGVKEFGSRLPPFSSASEV